MEMKCLRTVFGVRKVVYVRNDIVRECYECECTVIESCLMCTEVVWRYGEGE